MHDTIQKTLDTVLEDNAKEGTYRVARDIFTDPEIFELEMMPVPTSRPSARAFACS